MRHSHKLRSAAQNVLRLLDWRSISLVFLEVRITILYTFPAGSGKCCILWMQCRNVYCTPSKQRSLKWINSTFDIISKSQMMTECDSQLLYINPLPFDVFKSQQGESQSAKQTMPASHLTFYILHVRWPLCTVSTELMNPKFKGYSCIILHKNVGSFGESFALTLLCDSSLFYQISHGKYHIRYERNKFSTACSILKRSMITLQLSRAYSQRSTNFCISLTSYSPSTGLHDLERQFRASNFNIHWCNLRQESEVLQLFKTFLCFSQLIMFHCQLRLTEVHAQKHSHHTFEM